MNFNSRFAEVLEGDNFKLRQFILNDVVALYEAIKGTETAKHMVSEKFSVDDCIWLVNDNIKHWEIHGYGSWAVTEKHSDNIIGWAGFKFWRPDEVEILSVFGPQSSEIGKEMLDFLLDYGFKVMNLDKVYILLPQSRPTYNFVEKVGFTDCGLDMFEDEQFKKYVYWNPDIC